jgi:hypothetical protein
VNIDNHFTGVGLHGVYDSRYDRVIITKLDYVPKYDNIIYDYTNRNFYQVTAPAGIDIRTQVYLTDLNYFCNKSWTVSYNLNTGTWISFHSYLPNWYVAENNFFYSGLNDCCGAFDAVAGNVVPEPSTTTTTSSSTTTTTSSSTTSTTTTLFTGCDLAGTAVAYDCALAGTAVDTTPTTTTTTTTSGPGEILITNNVTGVDTSEITNVYTNTIDTFFTITGGAYPILPEEIMTGTNGGVTTAIKVDISNYDEEASVGNSLQLFQNGVFIECRDVTADGTYAFTPITILLTDDVVINLNSGSCF